MEANGTHRLGYEDFKVSKNQYRIKYLDVNSQKAYRGFMRRASTLTLENGFTHFTVAQQGANREADRNVKLTSGVTQNWALDQFEATVTMQNSPEGDATDAKEFLVANPILTPKGRATAAERK